MASASMALPSHHPLGERILVPRRPWSLRPLREERADLPVLIADRLLGIHANEPKDERQRFVFANDARDEALIALDGVIQLGHVLAGFVEARCARRGYASFGGSGRHGKVKHEIGPEQRLIELQDPVEVEPASDVPRERGEQKTVGNDQLARPERRQNDMVHAMAEISGVQKGILLRAERPHGFATLDDWLDQIRRVPLGRHYVIAIRRQPGLEQLPLRGLARTIRTLEGDEKPSARKGGVGEMPADLSSDSAVPHMVDFLEHCPSMNVLFTVPARSIDR